MPELPEVETICNSLRASPIIGRKIITAELHWARTLAEPSPQEFTTRILSQTITEVGRRGKFLIFQLTREVLLIHLRMSGEIFLEPDGNPWLPHHRLILRLEGGIRLAFNDARKFGRVWLVSDPQKVVQDLGPEPLDPNFTPQVLYQKLQLSRRQIKPLLMDQTFLAGLGNIYADEALHLARLHPLTPANQITFSQAERLWQGIRQALEAGIRHQGASIDWVYRGGDFQNYFRVYRRTGEPCPECGTAIVRITVGQRGAHFCPTCQTLQG